MHILVCGGAGYIGSHTVKELIRQGHCVTVLDNLSTGHRMAVDAKAKFYEGDLFDTDILQRVFTEQKVDAVMDFAAFSLVGESVEKPFRYFWNNIGATLHILEAMRQHNVLDFIFSSTAAVYGEPEHTPILETDQTAPTNPYGESKLAVEKILSWFSNAHGMRYAVLRYFNAAGADMSGEIGEDHHPETHLIPIVLQVALGIRESIHIFGEDYPTPDGTCIRDYIHVTDLAQAHILALEKLREDHENRIYNLGNGTGFSVREVIEAARRVTGHSIPAVKADRRAGDPSVLVASSEKVKEILPYVPQFSTLDSMIATAWEWHTKHPNGYGES